MNVIPAGVGSTAINTAQLHSGNMANGASGAGAPASNLFQHLVESANLDQKVSEQAIQDFVEQKPNASVQKVVMAMADAELSFQFFMEIRNQLISSYNDLMRMQF